MKDMQGASLHPASDACYSGLSASQKAAQPTVIAL
jgi:hypothetical protein